MNNNNLENFAHVAGFGGILLAALAGLLRVLGFRTLAGFETMTLLDGAIALMAASCVVQLYLLRRR